MGDRTPLSAAHCSAGPPFQPSSVSQRPPRTSQCSPEPFPLTLSLPPERRGRPPPAPYSLPSGTYRAFIGSPLSLLSSILSNPTSLCCPPRTHRGASMPLLQPQNGTQRSRCGRPTADYRGTIAALFLPAALVLIRARMPLALSAPWAHCWQRSVRHQSTPPDPFPPHGLAATLPQTYRVARGYWGRTAGPGIGSC